MSKKCPICGNKVGLVMNFALKDGKICTDCGTKIGLKDTGMASMNVAELLTIQDVINYQNNETIIDPKKYWTDYKLQLHEKKSTERIIQQHQNTDEDVIKEKQTDKEKNISKIMPKPAKDKYFLGKKCPICGYKVDPLDHFNLKNGKVCSNCGEKAGLSGISMTSKLVAELLTIQDVIDYQKGDTKIDPKQYWADYKAGKKQQKADNKAQYEELMNEFKTDNAWHIGKVYFDDKKNQILLKKSMIDGIANEPTRIHEYSDLESYSPIETPTTIEKKHGVGRSIVGGLVAGPTGAVLGAFSGNKSYDAVSKVSMMLYFKDDRREEAVLLNTDTKTSSGTYQAVQKSILNISRDLDKIIAANTPAAPAQSDNAHSSADDLRELKQLLDDGILTEEEFTAKKKQILGI